MSHSNERYGPYIMFGIYTIVGAVSRYFITLPCGSYFENIHVFASQFSVIFILSGIGWGLHSFFFPKKCRSRLGHGVITGLGLGFGGTTAIFLLTNPCG